MELWEGYIFWLDQMRFLHPPRTCTTGSFLFIYISSEKIGSSKRDLIAYGIGILCHVVGYC
jgi:hypothetical protein